MKPKGSRKSFKETQEAWYALLKKKGFQDIEDTEISDRPLKEWHSSKFMTDRSLNRQAARENYNQMMDNFINSRAINEICKLITEHGNSALKPRDAKKILELHRDGFTERKIAEKIKVGKKCVHLTLEKARSWMKVA